MFIFILNSCIWFFVFLVHLVCFLIDCVSLAFCLTCTPSVLHTYLLKSKLSHLHYIFFFFFFKCYSLLLCALSRFVLDQRVLHHVEMLFTLILEFHFNFHFHLCETSGFDLNGNNISYNLFTLQFFDRVYDKRTYMKYCLLQVSSKQVMYM